MQSGHHVLHVVVSKSKTGPVAQRIRHLTTNQGIAGSSPARVIFFFDVYVTKTLKTTIVFHFFTLLHSWEVAWKLLKSSCDVDSTNYHVTTAKVVTIYLDIEVNSQIIHVPKNLSILQGLNLPSPHPKCNTLSTTLCSPSSQTCLKYKR